MDFGDYWKKWLTYCVGEIIKENLERDAGRSQRSNFIVENQEYYVQLSGDLIMNN
ncbi:MAG TPA: hypothetical protein VH415_01495 [Nitrososphaeraceae archaeon]|jgi:hypothetical protein